MGASLKDLDYLGEPACEEGAFSVSPHLRLLHPLSGNLDEALKFKEGKLLAGGHTAVPWQG